MEKQEIFAAAQTAEAADYIHNLETQVHSSLNVKLRAEAVLRGAEKKMNEIENERTVTYKEAQIVFDIAHYILTGQI